VYSQSDTSSTREEKQRFVGNKPIKIGTWKGREVEYVGGRILLKLNEWNQREELFHFLRQDGGNIISELPELNWVVVDYDTGKNVFNKLVALEKNFLVKAAGVDQLRYMDETNPNDPYFAGTTPATYRYQWALYNFAVCPPCGKKTADIKAKNAWDVSRGASQIVLAVLDSGIPLINGVSSHPDFPQNKLILGHDYVNDDNIPEDDCRHGTHVAGIAGAETNDNEGISGVSWYSKILGIKVLNSYGSGTTSWEVLGIVEAVNYAISHPTERVIINMSLGGCDEDLSGAEEDAINFAYQNNVVVVVSAGNYPVGPGGCGYDIWFPAKYSSYGTLPGRENGYPNVLAVASTDHNDKRSWFSNFQPGSSTPNARVTLSAPGGYQNWENYGNPGGEDDIWSAAPNYPTVLWPSGFPYRYSYGTSMAAPHVSGLAALLWALNPSLSHAQVTCQIWKKCDKVGASVFTSCTRTDCGTSTCSDSAGSGRINSNNTLKDISILPIPSNLVATNIPSGSRGVYLLWNKPQTYGIILDYSVYRNDVLVATCTQQAYYDSTPTAGAYSYKITAKYGGNISSSPSSYVYVSTGNGNTNRISGCGYYEKIVAPQSPILPSTLILKQNFPNPFNPMTEIPFELSEFSRVQISIYDILGKKIIELLDEELTSGKHSIIWEGKDQFGNPASSGIYFIRLNTGNKTVSRPIVLLIK
jgi:subtilisin family serine protease